MRNRLNIHSVVTVAIVRTAFAPKAVADELINALGVKTSGVGGTGVFFSGGGNLIIEGCKVTNFASSGIAIAPTATSDIVVSSTLVAYNGGHGLYVQPSGGSTFVNVVLDGVHAYNNRLNGIGLYANVLPDGPGSLIAKVVDSVAAYNSAAGFYALGGGVPAVIYVFRSMTMQNSNGGIYADTNSQINVSQSNLEGDFWNAPGGFLCSYGDNYVNGIVPPGGCPTRSKT